MKKLKKRPELDDEAREAFLKLENKDPEMMALWKKCVDISMKEFERTYERLGVSFDHHWGESFYMDQVPALLNELREKNLLLESEGAWVVPVEDEKGNELPPCILQKKDGGSIYGTRDVAAAIYRHQKFGFDRMSYIVGKEQKLHFQQIFAVLKKMGFEWTSKCEHIPYGLYRFKGGKMSTRKGNFVTLDDVLQTTKDHVQETMRKRAESLSAKEKSLAPEIASFEDLEKTAETVAIGAVVFNDLSNDPVRDLDFDVERITDFEGETGPYLQYAHTRCLSVLRKAKEREILLESFPSFDSNLVPLLEKPEEAQLIKTLGQMPLKLERMLDSGKPSQLAHYLIDITRAFNAFYRECRVLSQDEKLSLARLMLVESTRRTLARGLHLLGIPLPERM
jgi:arginyl-tRNA synthetase